MKPARMPIFPPEFWTQHNMLAFGINLFGTAWCVSFAYIDACQGRMFSLASLCGALALNMFSLYTLCKRWKPSFARWQALRREYYALHADIKHERDKE